AVLFRHKLAFPFCPAALSQVYSTPSTSAPRDHASGDLPPSSMLGLSKMFSLDFLSADSSSFSLAGFAFSAAIAGCRVERPENGWKIRPAPSKMIVNDVVVRMATSEKGMKRIRSRCSQIDDGPVVRDPERSTVPCAAWLLQINLGEITGQK